MQWLNQRNIHVVLMQATTMVDSALMAEAKALELAAQIERAMKV
jgi:hypothetical protein